MNELHKKINEALNTSIELLQKRLAAIAKSEIILESEAVEVREVVYTLTHIQNHLDQLARA